VSKAKVSKAKSSRKSHKYSKCKISPPDPHDCTWIDLPEKYDTGEDRGENWQQCSDNQWCDECIKGYHEVCNSISNEISSITGINASLDEVARSKLLTKLSEQFNGSKRYEEYNEMIKKIKSILDGYKRCNEYRQNVYGSCFRNTKDQTSIMDKRHFAHYERMLSIKTDLEKLNNKIKDKAKIIKLSKDQNPSTPPTPQIRSLTTPKKILRGNELEQTSSVIFVYGKVNKQKGKKGQIKRSTKHS